MSLRPIHALAAAGALVAFVGCGGAARAARTSAPAPATTVAAPTPPAPAAGGTLADCPQIVTLTLGQITKSIYGQAISGREVAASTKRLARSSRLAAAVAHDDPYETAAALAPLIKHQIVRIVITDAHGKRLASHGSADAVAPVHRVIVYGGRVVGAYDMSVSGERALVSEMSTITGARIVVRGGAGGSAARLHRAPAALKLRGVVHVGGHTYRATSFRGVGFPAGSMRFWTLVPKAATQTCGATRDETVTETIGAVGQRLLTAEATGSAVHRVLHVVGTDRGFARAVAARDPTAMKLAVLRLFKDRNLHVVRIAATLPDGKLLNDVGGPYALAAATGPVTTPDGRNVGTVTLSVQDDTGYIKLMHRFTGAAVQLRLPREQVPGSTLDPGPASIPDRGPVAYAGRAYHAYSFAASAFDGAPLRISLLVPDGRL